MAFEQQVQVLGDTTTYVISPQIKKYTLMDLGFVQGNSGAFVLERSLDPNSPYNAAFKLRMTVSKDLSGFKLAVTNGNGLAKVNIFAKNAHPETVEQFKFVMQNLLDRQVLTVKN